MPEAESYAPTASRPEDLEAALKKIQVVDISEAIGAHAIDAADDYLSRETSQKGVKGFVKKIFKGNLVRDVVRQRQIHKGRQEIIESGNIYALQGGDQADHDEAVAAVVERFTSDYDLLHRQAGETNEAMEGTLLGQLKQLIGEFAHNSAMSIEALEEAKNRVLHEYGQRVHAKDRNKGLLYADNIIEVAQNARFAAEHELARDRIEAALSGQIGEAKVGVRTEARLQAIDKSLDWLHNHHVTLVNEGTLGIAMAIGLSAAKWTSRSALSAAARMAIPGIGAGLIAGAREHLRVGQERTLHMRQMAEGGEMPAENAPRREKMEGARYETVSATELIDQLDGVGELLDNGALLEAIASINAAEVRIGMSDQRNIDLISYSSKTSVEQERFELDMRLAEAKVLLQRKLNSLDDEALAGLGLASKDLATALSARNGDLEEYLLGDISEKDQAFKKLRRNRTLKMAAVGAAMGVTLGIAFQEAHAALDGGLRGVLEGSGGNRQSLLSALLRHAHHPSGDQHREFFEGGHHFKDTAVDLPPGYHLVQTNPGEKFGWEVQGPDGKNVLDHLDMHKFLEQMQGDHNQHHLHHISGDHLGVGFDTQGNLDYESREALRSLGFDLHQHAVGFKEPHLVTHDVTRNIHEYLRAHPRDFVRAHRELWYDNNTPGVYDQNELRLDWGAGGVGIDSHGNYVLNVASMMPDGSFHEGLSTNAQQLVHEGKMAIALSMSRDTQHFVHLVNIDKNGNAVIKADSFLGRSLFANQDGHARFIGGYAEAAQLMGKTPDGGESIRMLATVVGENHPHSATDQVTRLVMEHHTHYVTDIEAPKDLPVEVPPVIPIYSRKGLENLADSRGETAYGYYNYNYGYRSSEITTKWKGERSPRLKNNPDAQLDAGQELGWYRKKLGKDRGKEYLKEVDERIETDEVLKNIGAETKALVCMPVEATAESDNIYKTLSLYAQQSAEAKKATVVVLNVNWKESVALNPEMKAKIDKTLSEIDRAKAAFPDLRIAVFKKEWSDEFIKSRKERIFGEVVKTLYDTAALAVERAVSEGRRPSAYDAVLITNDADAHGLRKNYLDLYIKAMESEPSADVFAGIIRGGIKEYADVPGFGVVNGLYYVMNAMYYREHRKNGRRMSTPGANSGFRLSTLAAVGGSEDRNDLGVGADGAIGRKVQAAREGSNPDRAVTKHVAFAQIDTDPDRLLGAYMSGRFVGSAWNDFDDGGGYKPRTEARGVVDKENIEKDIDDIARRIEINIEGFASGWYQDEATVDSALALYFGLSDRNGNPLYTKSWKGGSFSFKFTEEGKVHLRNVLLRDSKGRYDHYGSRTRRRLYSDTLKTQGEGREPGTINLESPRLVSHT
ncbi:MAG TPA: hypothetical protein VG964_03900 [Candidatus Saccharimonadales bacterium]|nr:hypothetical protein [Candidatus Saccharimonadales bacterium]